MHMMNTVSILDCTLRDGSYAIDYQFTAEDTAIIAVGLEKAGFDFIEIGHGLGLGASSEKYGSAAATDEEYLAAAQKTLKKAKFGMFCIPGIATLKDVENAVRHNIGFIRIGTNVTQIEQAEAFIKKAKDLGIKVFSNLMKSYAVSSLEFANKVKHAYAYGADVICVVDSAGGMLPADVHEYIRIVKNETNAKIGFHGHDNLRLAVANSLEAAKSGADIIDASLGGLGRSSGNAQTEIMVILLEKSGYKTGVDLYKTLNLSERVIKPIAWEGKGVDATSAILGASQFHSSFMQIIRKFSRDYGVDERELIAGVSKIDKVNVTDSLVRLVAKKLKPAKSHRFPVHFDFDGIMKKHKPNDIANISRDIANELVAISKKTGRKIIFTLAKTCDKNKKCATFPFVRHNEIYIIGNAEAVSETEALAIITSIDGLVDYILIDHHLFAGIKNKLKNLKSAVLSYSDADAQVVSILKMIIVLSQNIPAKVFVSGSNYLCDTLILHLLSQEYYVINKNAFRKKELYGNLGKKLLDENLANIKDADFIIGLTPFEASIALEIVKTAKKGAIVIDAGPASVSTKAVMYAIKENISIYRLDMRAGLFGEIEAVIKNCYLKTDIMGKGKIRGIRVVSGGVIGKKGDVVLNTVKDPSRIIGIADGQGSLLKAEDEAKFFSKVKKVKLSIAKSIFS